MKQEYIDKLQGDSDMQQGESDKLLYERDTLPVTRSRNILISSCRRATHCTNDLLFD